MYRPLDPFQAAAHKAATLASHHCHRESRPQQHGLTSIGCRSLAPLEQNKNYVNSWLHGALNGARSVIANFEGPKRARRRATMGAVKFRSRLDRKKPATDFPARAQFSIFAMTKICR